MRIMLLVLAVACFICEPVSANKDSQKEVKQAFESFIRAFNNLEWDAFRNTFADDITIFNPDIPEASGLGRLDGRQQVEASFKSVFAATLQQASGPPYLHIVPKNVRVQIYGDSAIVTFQFERDGFSFGRRTMVFHRESAGWRIVHIHASNVARRN